MHVVSEHCRERLSAPPGQSTWTRGEASTEPRDETVAWDSTAHICLLVRHVKSSVRIVVVNGGSNDERSAEDEGFSV